MKAQLEEKPLCQFIPLNIGYLFLKNENQKPNLETEGSVPAIQKKKTAKEKQVKMHLAYTNTTQTTSVVSVH